VFSASELLEAMERRARRGRSIRPPRPPGEFPPGWDAWFVEPPANPRRRARAVDAVVAVLAARPPLRREPYRPIGNWQAFVRLWGYDRRAASASDRRTRTLSMSLSVLLHVLWLQLMILLMVGRYPGQEEDAARLGENITQVEFIGEGTPQDAGGGAQSAPEPEPRPETRQAAAAAAPAPAAAPAAPTPPATPPEPSVAEVEVPPQEAPPPVAEQPLEVTQTPEPDSDFVLAPPRIDALPLPTLRAPDAVATPELQVEEVPLPAPAPQVRPLPTRDITVPDLRQPEVQITERELPRAPSPVTLQVPTRAPPAPWLDREAPAIGQREIELRAPPAQGAGSAQAEAEAARGATQADGRDEGTSSVTAATRGGMREGGQGAAPTSAGAGAGRNPQSPPGGLPSPRVGDDWGDSDRNVAGGQAGSSSGLFNADGSPRLAGTGNVGGGLPPGTITEDYEKIDRMGTWLKRPPVGYEPTALDRFWVPHETLLEEWVRRSIKEVLIPIPGTGKRIRCAVALLMLGGACGLSDPNMLDVEAEARKPPDVPFKPELQQDQESLARPPGG